MSSNTRSLGYLLAFLSAAAGAVRYNLAVFAQPRGFGYVWFLACALAVGVACSMVHVLAVDGPGGLRPFRGRWHHGLLYGILMAWGTLCYFLALEYLNEVVMTSLSQTGILVTIGLAVWLLGERFNRMEWAAMAIILAGVFLFRPWEGVRLKGFVILMSGVVGTSFATIGAKRWVAGVAPRVLMLWRNCVALVVVGVYALLFREHPTITARTALACVGAGILGPYLHGLFFLLALKHVDASKASLVNRVQPALVALLSWLLLDRLPRTEDAVSAALLVAGTAWLAMARPKRYGA